MNKVLLLDDRKARQYNKLEQNNINLEFYGDYLDNCTENQVEEILENIKNNNINFSEYHTIICHDSATLKSDEKSIYNSQIIMNLKNYCKENKKALILFSGGISKSYYSDSIFEFLKLNSDILYSSNLVIYLEKLKTNSQNILMLNFGENWQINIVLGILEEVNNLIENIDKEYIFQGNFFNTMKLKNIKFDFYEPIPDGNKIYISELKKFQFSLNNYIDTLNESIEAQENKSILIHHNNVVVVEDFNKVIDFEMSNNTEDIDEYITKEIINCLKDLDFNKIFIKDNLSKNYLELYGIRVANHIRLSNELNDKRFVPIIIISELDFKTIHGLSNECNILNTQGTYICKNEKEDIEKYKNLSLKSLNKDKYSEFLLKIDIEKPKDLSANHDITNEWSIYKWAEYLNIKSESVDKNRKKMEHQLYFKYLRALYKQNNNQAVELQKPLKKGKVLLVDDEWNKGWKDIIKSTLCGDKIEIEVFEYDFRDKKNFNLIVQVKHKKLKEQIQQADVVILDLRLTSYDHENNNIDEYSGIKILEKIHEINAGIQVIMLTATSKSTTLEKLYDKKILGYIKKEHPEDISIDTSENINKIIKLVDKGLEKKYLKEIWQIQKNILLNKNLPEDIYLEVKNIFEILDSDMKNRFNFVVLTFTKIFESISKIYIDEKTMQYIEDGKNVGVYNYFNNTINNYTDEKWYKNTQNRVHNIVYYKLNIKDEKTHKYICEIINCRNYLAHPNEKKPVGCRLIKSPNYQHILNWFKIIEDILNIRQNMSN